MRNRTSNSLTIIVVFALAYACVSRRVERLIFSGDSFDAQSVATACYDTPPKGRIAKPVAHLQSIRFLRLGRLLQNMKLPVFVSDIDLLLQRGVEDLLARCKDADVVFNENTIGMNAGDTDPGSVFALI
jgi:hypothetical protein